jgi:hypothetical protein
MGLSTRTRLLLVVVLGLGALAGLQHLGGMDRRFFQPSPSGTWGLMPYLTGNYAGAAQAYRAHFAGPDEPLPGRPAAEEARSMRALAALLLKAVALSRRPNGVRS